MTNISTIDNITIDNSNNNNDIGNTTAIDIKEVVIKNITIAIEDEFVQQTSSNYAYPTPILTLITVVYFLIFASSIIGNTSTCIVIFRNRYMHTATNYYLFSLAISDLVLVLSGLPKEIYELWFRYAYIFGETSCIMQGFLSETATNATVLTITAFTIERYIAICYPFISHTVSKLSRALKHIIVIWIVALFLAIPQAIQFGIEEGKGKECTVKSQETKAFVMSSLLFFIIPMCVISILYVLIGLRLRISRRMKMKSSSKSANAASLDIRTRTNQTKIIRMLVAVVVAFVICWAPFHAQRLLALYGSENADTIKKDSWVVTTYIALTHISGIFYFMSTTINPLLYNIMSHKFRHAFKVTFGTLCGCKPTIDRRRTVTSLIRTRSYRTTTNHHFRSSECDSNNKEAFPLYNNNGTLVSKNGKTPCDETTTENKDTDRFQLQQENVIDGIPIDDGFGNRTYEKTRTGLFDEIPVTNIN